MNKPTRFYSKKQEKRVAHEVGGDVVVNSGATRFQKGDVSSKYWLFDAKTSTSPKSSVTIKKSWIEKINEEAFAMGKAHGAVIFDFGDGDDFVILDVKTFTELIRERSLDYDES